jgi:hypothetical protein
MGRHDRTGAALLVEKSRPCLEKFYQMKQALPVSQFRNPGKGRERFDDEL